MRIHMVPCPFLLVITAAVKWPFGDKTNGGTRQRKHYMKVSEA